MTMVIFGDEKQKGRLGSIICSQPGEWKLKVYETHIIEKPAAAFLRTDTVLG